MADKKILGSLEVTGTIGDGTNTLSVQDIVNKEDKSNKVTSLSASSTNTQYPSAKAVWDLVQAIKRNAFTPVDIETYPTLADFLASTGEEGYLYLYPVDTSDLSKGYHTYIYEVDEINNTAQWVYMGDTSLDLTNYTQKNVKETITAVWTIADALEFKRGNNGKTIYDNNDLYGLILRNDGGNVSVRASGLIPFGNNVNLGTNDYKWKDLFLSGGIDFGGLIKINGANKYNFTNWDILPYGNQTLGNVSYKFGGLYLTDNATITDGTYSVKVSEIGKKLLSLESQRHLTSGEAKQCVGGIQVVSSYFLNLGNGVLLKNPYITGIQVSANNIDITAVGLNTTSQLVLYKGRLTINTSDDTVAVTESNIVSKVLDNLATTDYFGFPIITAPSSTTLTADEVATISNGAIFLGSSSNKFLTYEKIVFFPLGDESFGENGGFALCVNGFTPEIRTYRINSSNVISLQSVTTKRIRLQSVAQINGANIPDYPTDTTKQYKFVQKAGGSLDYVEENTILELTSDYSLAQSGNWTKCNSVDNDLLDVYKDMAITELLSKHLVFKISTYYCVPITYGANSFSFYSGTEKASNPLIIQYFATGVSDGAGWYFLKR